MAISRDNAEIVAKEIQISLNLFERAEHVLKNAFSKSPWKDVKKWGDQGQMGFPITLIFEYWEVEK